MEAREAITVRLPSGLLARAKGVRVESESLNDVLIEAVEKEVRRRYAARAFESIIRVRDEILADRGPSPDSGTTIRELRDGKGRRD
jgi:hypothetical protein